MKHDNWEHGPYHIYGDNSNRQYIYQELKKHFNINGRDYARCIKDLHGDPERLEFFSHQKGEIVIIEKTIDGFQIR